ncbi:MAG: hypothetical protein H0S79_13665 [Anaerolineaceae bacterium]|nr:hypothetical protein [Anaerolineaceae bacterium]
MKSIEDLSQAELAAYVQEKLRQNGIEVVLSGGAAVGIYSGGKYVSKDIDLVNARFANRKSIEKVMLDLGFISVGRHFEHPESNHIIEFPPGPLSLGDSIVKDIEEIKFGTGILHLLTPTDCIKDRLAHFYHWGDRQCLSQAVLIAESHQVNFKEIREWSESEGKLSEFNQFIKLLDKHGE